MSYFPLPQALRRWRAPALAAAALLGAPLAWGACVDTAAQGKADGGSTCTATRSTYTNNEDTLLARTGGKLTVSNSVTFTAGGTMGGWYRGIVRADGAGSKIEFRGDVTLPQEEIQHSYGLYANNGGRISVSGTTNVQFLPGSGLSDDRLAVYALGTDSQITLGAVSLTVASGANACTGLVTESGGKITYTTATINTQSYVAGIRQDGAGDVIGGDTTINIGASADGIGVVSSNLVRINGTLNVIGSGYVDGLITRDDGQIHVGANSKIQSTNGTGVSIMGYNATPLMAGNGLQIDYTGTNSTAFNASNTAAASTTLTNATVTAETLWLAIGSDYTFNAQGGTYTGKSTGNPLTLKMSNAAVWNLNDDSDLGKMELTGNAALKLDTSHTLTASDAAGVKNTSGIIDLKDATPATGDVLTIAGNYAGGGKLKLDVNLASGGGGAIGVDADALKVTGNVTGSTQIEVTQLPGTGIATTGNGILVAEISGTSPANAFTLLSPVISGGFQYTLHQVGNRWYLRSSPYTGANVASVPTLSHLGLLLTGGLLAGAAARARRKQKKA